MIKIDTQNVDFYYGDFHALQNISMQIEANTSVAFIGPSGCGKSTFLRLFNRMNDLIPDTRLEGKIFINGRNIYDKGEKVDTLRKNVGMVFQKPNPFPKTIFENVAHGLRVNGVKDHEYIEETIVRSLKQVVLWDEVKDKLKDSAFALSGGQQQRLCIARALAVSPSILLMDEPTSALDPISTSKIEDLIHELKKDIIALYAPVAIDLRFVLTMYKINTNLERLGDFAESIARFSVNLPEREPIDPELVKITRVEEMLQELLTMISLAQEAFEKESSEIASRIFLKDTIIDKINHDSTPLIAQYIEAHPGSALAGLYMAGVIRKMERFGDHCTNIAEELIFYLDAKVMKHMGKTEEK